MTISLADRAAITDVLNLYAHFADTKQFQRIADELFTADVVCDFGMILNGAAAYVDFVTGFQGILGTFHNISNILIEGDDKSARAQCHVTAWHMFDQPADPAHPQGPRSELTMYGGYEDALVNTSKGWRITSRKALEYRPGQAAFAADGSVSEASGLRHPSWP